jgi:hypoxanthine-DNA glycosylase
VNADVRLLLLGSLPGERSLQEARYYAHPQNQFWRLTSELVGCDLTSLDYHQRLQHLLGAGIGLWDVVASATRQGSLDSSIRAHQPNPLSKLARSLSKLRAIGFNGGTSAQLGLRELGPDAPWALIPLPSSSPAYTLAFERKREAWLRLRDFL